MSDMNPRRTAGSVLSVHRTSQGLVQYRWWPGRITVELLPLDEPAQILALVPGTKPTRGAVIGSVAASAMPGYSIRAL
jgi:hypothetical protein